MDIIVIIKAILFFFKKKIRGLGIKSFNTFLNFYVYYRGFLHFMDFELIASHRKVVYLYC